MITSLLFNPGTESQIKGDIETHSNLAERGNPVSDRKNHVVWWILKIAGKKYLQIFANRNRARFIIFVQ
jgi:hypothetical protein